LIVSALVATGLSESNAAARRAIEQGAVSLNKVKIESIEATVDDFLPGEVAVLARGKKNLAALFRD
jgi:tyrosyl-tRNA synthetase